MKKRMLFRALTLILCFNLLCPVSAEAVSLVNPKIPCRSAILVEGLTGKVLYQKEADKPLPPASVTKMMSLLLIAEDLESEKFSLSDIVTASPHAVSMGGSQIWLREKEEMTVEELLKAVIIASANDATVALAEFSEGSEDAFAERMNERAKELGLKNSHFKNCTGLDEEGHFMSAEDISRLAMELLKHPLIKKYSKVWMDELRGGKTSLVNTNRLIKFYKGATGLKTGTTDDALCCLCATAERDNLPLIAVVLGCPDSDTRFKSCRALLDFGFSSYKAEKTPDLKEALTPLRIKNGENRFVSLKLQKPEYILVEKGKRSPLLTEVQRDEILKAPLAQNTKIGTAKIMQDGVILAEIPILTAFPIEKLSYITALKRILLQYFSC